MKKRKILSAALAAALSLSLLTPAMAAELPADDPTQAAQALYDLGLFNGTGVDENGQPIYDLDRTPTRNEAVTMLVRLLGKDEEAKAGTWETPFTDVEAWAAPYVGYAYANKLTTGTSDTTFGGAQTVSPSQYLTFVLRAMGYESGTDFQWDKAWELTDTLGITHGEYGPDTSFTRGNVALISHSALSASPKGGDKSLLESLGLGKPEPTPPPTPTPTPAPTPSVPATDLELVNKGESTDIDPQKPVENAPFISEVEIPNGMGLKVGESDDGLTAAGSERPSGNEVWTTESEKYVQLSDKVTGKLTTEYSEGDVWNDGYCRISNVDIVMYVGDTITLNVADFGRNAGDEYWYLDDETNYISVENNESRVCTIKAQKPVSGFDVGSISSNASADKMSLRVTIYEKRPSNWNANFHISTDYEPVYYTNGTLGTWWVTEKGVKFNGSNGAPAKSEFGMNADYIRIYPDSSMGIPSSDIENGYIKDEAVGKYFDSSCNLEEYNNRRINVGPTGGIETPCVDFTSSNCDHKATITVTSKKDGRSCSIDIACIYYQP